MVKRLGYQRAGVVALLDEMTVVQMPNGQWLIHAGTIEEGSYHISASQGPCAELLGFDVIGRQELVISLSSLVC